jgi:hypothetical protein
MFLRDGIGEVSIDVRKKELLVLGLQGSKLSRHLSQLIAGERHVAPDAWSNPITDELWADQLAIPLWIRSWSHYSRAGLVPISPEVQPASENFPMALSDAYFEFLNTVAEAAAQLSRDAHRYSDPDYPISYGTEADALRHACKAAAAVAPFDPDAMTRVVKLAHSVMRYHDTPPEPEEARRVEMRRLVKALQKELDPEEAAAVPAVIEQVMKETPDTATAAKRLKAMLLKLGKPTYDVAIKIISDIGSATVKKMLGL